MKKAHPLQMDLIPNMTIVQTMNKDSKYPEQAKPEGIRYAHFPLILLGKLHTNEATIHDIFNYAMVNTVLRFKSKQSEEKQYQDVALQFAYTLNRVQDDIPGYIMNTIEEISLNVEFLQCGELIPAIVKRDYLSIREWIDPLIQESKIREFAERNYRLGLIPGWFKLEKNISNIERYYDYMELQIFVDDYEEKYGTDSYVGIEGKMFLDLANDDKLDPVVFCAYAAIRSMEKNGNYTATNRATVVGRALGFKSEKVKKELCDKNPFMAGLFKMYSGRKRFNTLFEKVSERKLIKCKVSRKGRREILISTNVGENEALELHIQKIRNSKKFKERQERKKREKIASDKLGIFLKSMRDGKI